MRIKVWYSPVDTVYYINYQEPDEVVVEGLRKPKNCEELVKRVRKFVDKVKEMVQTMFTISLYRYQYCANKLDVVVKVMPGIILKDAMETLKKNYMDKEGWSRFDYRTNGKYIAVNIGISEPKETWMIEGIPISVRETDGMMIVLRPGIDPITKCAYNKQKCGSDQ